MITLSSPPSLNSINIIRCCDDDDADTIVVDYCCCSPNHLQAQRFNNIAATCMIEHGQQNYEKAISILEQALRICEKEKDQEDVHEHFYEVCSCNSCSIDRLLSVSSECDSDSDNDMHEDNDKDGTTIYQNPISVQEGHNMGSTLTHIIAFNLAIVHHLHFVMANNNDDILINKALKCYELAYECNLSDTCSIWFDEMICNNLSHIYRYQEQTEEERTFQQQQQQQKTLEQEKETLHHLQEPISVSDDEDDDNDDDVSNSSFDPEDLLELESYSHEVEQEDYEQERKQRKRKHTQKLTTTQRQRNKLLHKVDDDDLDQYPNVIDTCSVLHNKCSHSGGEKRDIFQEVWG
mmetsp:Transcript_36358/g.41581  ORF Transcript_36358/g.41581 Transcript_36358/m.41581 type:complete len:349 (-) Transcript_36358:305-1351(-)